MDQEIELQGQAKERLRTIEEEESMIEEDFSINQFATYEEKVQPKNERVLKLVNLDCR